MKNKGKFIIERIKVLLKTKNITQADLAKKMGYKSVSNVSSILSTSNISVDKLFEFIEAADISLIELFEVDTKNNIVSSELAAEASALMQIKDEPIKNLITALSDNNKLKIENEELKKEVLNLKNNVDQAIIDKLNFLEEKYKKLPELETKLMDLQNIAIKSKDIEEENSILKKTIIDIAENNISKPKLKKLALKFKHEK